MASSHEFKLEYRGVIEFSCKEGSSAKEIHSRTVKVYCRECPSHTTVTWWFNEFTHGCVHAEDNPRSGRLPTSTNLDHSASAESLIMNNRRIKVSEVAGQLNISYGSAFTIIHNVLGVSKVSARWVPRNLSAQDGHHRLHSPKKLLHLYSTYPGDFFSRLVTGNQMRLHQRDPETNSSLCSGGIWGPLPRECKDPTLREESDGDTFLVREGDPAH